MFNILKNRKLKSGLYFKSYEQYVQYVKDLEEAFLAGYQCGAENNFKNLPYLRKYQ
jgi:hypothetical protein